MATRLISASEHRRLPQQFGSFLLDKAIWKSAHSTVYFATDLRDQAQVALKVLYPKDEADIPVQRRAAKREAARLREVKHPNTIELRQQFEVDNVPYLSFPFINGEGLDQALKNKRLPQILAVHCIIQAATALHHAHRVGIIHRDLKPRNIMIDQDKNAKVLDWGLSWKKGDARRKDVQEIVGTPAYMSPEQARGDDEKLTPASDVYSLGAILYHLLTNQPPFDAETSWKTLQMAMSMPLVAPRRLNSEIDPELERVILICLEKDPDRRYDSAEALAKDLERVTNSQKAKGNSSILGRLFGGQ